MSGPFPPQKSVVYLLAMLFPTNMQTHENRELKGLTLYGKAKQREQPERNPETAESLVC